MKIELTSKERAAFRSKAQTLDPVVMVGRDGVSENVVNAMNQALDCHELVKVRFQDFKKDTKVLSLDLEKATDSTLISTTGFTAVFFRENPELKKK